MYKYSFFRDSICPIASGKPTEKSTLYRYNTFRWRREVILEIPNKLVKGSDIYTMTSLNCWLSNDKLLSIKIVYNMLRYYFSKWLPSKMELSMIGMKMGHLDLHAMHYDIFNHLFKQRNILKVNNSFSLRVIDELLLLSS